jgi:3-isopropylmalate/(R)-2-methylmalate dehydratase small subunit
MKAVTRVVGRVLPLDRANVDTDQIIPAHWLKRTLRTGYGAGLFEAWRADPAFVMNDPRYAGATILVAGANFGSGSSREHAAWALAEAGFAAVVAPSLADIFRGNAVTNGIVPVTLDDAAVRALIVGARALPRFEVTIDVASGTLDAPAIGLRERFALDPRERRALLEGLDEIAHTLEFERAIASYESTRAAWLPSVTRRAT